MEVISRKRAKEQGLTRFFTGEPCKYGHVSPRYTSTRTCVECSREHNMKERNRQSIRDATDGKIVEAFKIYGSACQHCGEPRWVLLDFHHRNGRSHHANDDMKVAAGKIIQAGEPLEEYELLCANCHRLADLRDGTGKRGRRMARLQKNK